jgi:hypothetical protein
VPVHARRRRRGGRQAAAGHISVLHTRGPRAQVIVNKMRLVTFFAAGSRQLIARRIDIMPPRRPAAVAAGASSSSQGASPAPGAAAAAAPAVSFVPALDVAALEPIAHVDLRVTLKGAYVIVFGSVTPHGGGDDAELPGHVPLRAGGERGADEGGAADAAAAEGEGDVDDATSGYAPGRASRAAFWRLPRTVPPRRTRLSISGGAATLEARRRSSVVADADAALAAALAAAWSPRAVASPAAAAATAAAARAASEIAASHGAAALRAPRAGEPAAGAGAGVPLAEELSGFVASGAELGIEVDWELATVVEKCAPLRSAAEFVDRCVLVRVRACVCVCICLFVCMCLCVRTRARAR